MKNYINWLKLYILGATYLYINLLKEGISMADGYKRVSGNSNIAFDYPLRALIISSDFEDPDFSPDISMSLDDDSVFSNWMYIRKRRD